MEPNRIELVGYRCTLCGEDVVGEDGWWACACYKIGMYELSVDFHQVPEFWVNGELHAEWVFEPEESLAQTVELKAKTMAIRTADEGPEEELKGLGEKMARDAQEAMDKLLRANLLGQAPEDLLARKEKGLVKTAKVRKPTNREKRRERDRVKKARRR